ncbi:MAG: RluA family pseudouridine synthase [Clostridiales bacterium]|nr:RluA family pseudouridine synthase [Clostridiales bacterium]
MKTFYSKGRKLTVEITEYYKGVVSYSLANKLLRKKDVKVNGVRVKDDFKTNEGDKIEVYYDGEDKRAENLLYGDQNILVIVKPKGITAEDFYALIKNRYSEARFIHRLDRNTDGIMLFALNGESEKELLKGFKERTFDKYYLAEVYGEPKEKSATVTAYLKKDEQNGIVKIYAKPENGAEKIITSYSTLKSNGETSLLEVKLITGKTHQIRAHLAYIGHFIIGDGKYGYESVNRRFHATKQRLTAYKTVLYFNEDSPLYYLNGKEFKYKK